MTEDLVLLKMTTEKNRMVKEFISVFIGHEPTKEDRKEFTVMHGLNESRIYHRSVLVAHLKYGPQVFQKGRE